MERKEREKRERKNVRQKNAQQRRRRRSKRRAKYRLAFVPRRVEKTVFPFLSLTERSCSFLDCRKKAWFQKHKKKKKKRGRFADEISKFWCKHQKMKEKIHPKNHSTRKYRWEFTERRGNKDQCVQKNGATKEVGGNQTKKWRAERSRFAKNHARSNKKEDKETMSLAWRTRICFFLRRKQRCIETFEKM